VGPAPQDGTDTRILRAFLRLAAERGIEDTTTRAVAEGAGVNEVTVFRHFGDKLTLARAAIRHAAAADRFAAFTPEIDASSPERALRGLFVCLRFLRDMAREHRELLHFGVGAAARYPGLSADLAATPLAARDLMERALRQAAPALQPALDPRASALGLVGLVLLTVLWQSSGWLDLTDDEWDRILEAAIRPLLRQE
jgi:AcrR family transcriptional regulator